METMRRQISPSYVALWVANYLLLCNFYAEATRIPGDPWADLSETLPIFGQNRDRVAFAKYKFLRNSLPRPRKFHEFGNLAPSPNF